jgi:beta-galactosidase
MRVINRITKQTWLVKILVLVVLVSVIALSVLSSNLNTAVATEKPSETLDLINDKWSYWQDNTNDLAKAKSNNVWQEIQLPHTWNATDTIDTLSGYRRSASWYKRELTITDLNKVTSLYFEGSNFSTQVYLNDQLAGRHDGGYIGFEIDITPYLAAGKNELIVRVSNAYNPNLIPSQKADFFLYGGITRDVWLKQLPLTHIANLAVSTPQVSAEQAATSININLTNASDKPLNLTASIINPQGQVVLNTSTLLKANKGEQLATLDFPSLLNPSLWSTDAPQLYQLKVALSDQQGQVIHTATTRFGYRWFEMKPHQGFFLNGQPVLLRGTHRHEEHAGIGPAMSNAQHRNDMQMIKDMGANFVRLGHYPQDPEIYKAADELGLILWDELPWCRGGKGGEEWENNTENLWRAQIKQNYNHPSIIFWSLGNEIYWEEDFPGGGATEVINPYLQKLNDITKQLDPSRLTSIRKYYPGAGMVDAFSPSIWAGWYGGSYSQYEEALTVAHAKYPTFLHMEYGGSSHVGRHSETPVTATGLQDAQVSVSEAVNQAIVKSVAKDTDWNENYIVDLFDWHLNVSENFPGFAGNAQWAFKDFGTPLRPENPLPYMNQKGLVDREGNKKDAYYVFASYWSDMPFCYIESKTWTERNGPKEGRDVTVYCNTQTAELFLDGQSQGLKTKQKGVVPAGGLVWQVPFNQGRNELSVKGYIDGQLKANDSLSIQYVVGQHGKLDNISLTAKLIENNRWLITAQALDKEGNRVLDYAERAYFYNIGDEGNLLENYGTPTKSSTIEMANGLAKIEFDAGDKTSIIEFRSQNIKGIYVSVGAKLHD